MSSPVADLRGAAVFFVGSKACLIPIVHLLDVACISCWPYLMAKFKPVVVCTPPGGLLNFHCTKNWIYKNLPRANVVQKVKTSGKGKAKMVNTAFAWQFTWGCKFEGKCSIYYLCPWFNRGVHFFCTKPVKSKVGSNQIFCAVFAASGSEGLQVLFSGTGFVCCQGSPLFLTG